MNTLQNSSFRDPAGFVFTEESEIFRQVNKSYKDHYDHLMESGLYDSLVKDGMLIGHEEVGCDFPENSLAYKVIKPQKVPFISYPYEWCFSQLRDAALLTLEIEARALKMQMTLKDASAYNIQFIGGNPVFIDTLSFEKYRQGEPWIAYKQFCQHFLAPLAIMKYHSAQCGKMTSIFLDGIDLNVASSMLPFSSRLSFSMLAHIHLHAGFQKKYSDKPLSEKTISLNSRLGLIDSLKGLVKKMIRKKHPSQWAAYYEDIHYSQASLSHKKQLVESYIKKINPDTVWDLGGNAGVFSRLASQQGCFTVSTDLDPEAVERNYIQASKEKDSRLLPLVMDLSNPSPSIGWENRERFSFMERGPVDMIMALALIHHLVVSNNCTLEMVARFFASICKVAIVEFIPIDDKQMKQMLSTRKNVAHNYSKEFFEEAFSRYFKIRDERVVRESGRILYLMERY
ncbi:Nodulation protein noeA [Chitinispirillum alkaliphilum]|nr:Nodulation protein noeA [Chitinispirillum alkaliphilum]